MKKDTGILSEIRQLTQKNIRDYMMYIALALIMLFFTLQTGGGFLSARNITNLINQSGYVAVLAIGMTVILIIKHIDLSVGYVAGFSGAIAAILMTQYGMNEWLAIACVVGIGLLIGLYQGVLITRLGVPAFVTTLAGMSSSISTASSTYRSSTMTANSASVAAATMSCCGPGEATSPAA